MTYSLTRKEAIFRGMNVYKTGVPCTHGHIETRYVRSNNCTKCQKAATKKSWQKLKNEIERITKLEAIAGENRLDWQFECHRKRTGDALAKPPEPTAAGPHQSGRPMKVPKTITISLGNMRIIVPEPFRLTPGQEREITEWWRQRIDAEMVQQIMGVVDA